MDRISSSETNHNIHMQAKQVIIIPMLMNMMRT